MATQGACAVGAAKVGNGEAPAFCLVRTPVGRCYLGSCGETLRSLRLLAPDESLDKKEAGQPAGNRVLAVAQQQLRAYFAGELREFDLPLDLSWATPFQRAALEATARVPYGQTCSYGEIARAAGSPRAARAVGQAMAHNRLGIVIPCHRVVGSDGGLTGYGGGLDLKRWLLQFERDNC